MSEEGGDYKVFGLTGPNNIFSASHCHTDRTWRKQLLLVNDKYQKTEDHPFDECRNPYVKPRAPVQIDLLEHLHKRSDYA